MIPTTIELSTEKEEPQNSTPIESSEVAQRNRCAQEVLTVIPHLKRVIQYDREGMELPISLQQYSVLKALSEQQYLISELADMFKVSRPTMTRLIDSLEGRRRPGTIANDEEDAPVRRAKLVERVDCLDDRRLVYARITNEGLEMVRLYHSMAEETVITMLHRISLDELDNLEKGLVVLRRALEHSD
jgi:DNA-binding MarR family transcriptional regulator